MLFLWYQSEFMTFFKIIAPMVCLKNPKWAPKLQIFMILCELDTKQVAK